MTVNFPGLHSVHIEVRQVDGLTGQAGGALHAHRDWQTDRADIEVLPAVYDLVIRRGPASYVVDNVDCRLGNCQATASSMLTVAFPALSSVHTEVHLSDGQINRATGEVAAQKVWQNDRALIPVLRGVYDLAIHKGAATYIIDQVDCRSGSCEAVASATLTVAFPGLSAVDVGVSLLDGTSGAATGELAAQKTWQNDRAELTVLRGWYDLSLRQGPVSYVVDGLDCREATCQATVEPASLRVDFHGLNWVSAEVRQADGQVGLAGGAYVTRRTGQADRADFKLLPERYDLVIEKGPATYVIDDVDCRAGNCQVAASAKLTVDFPGLSAVHTDVRLPDGQTGTAGGASAAQKKWQDDLAEITVLRGIYDLEVQYGPTDFVIDQVDCRGSSCQATVQKARLLVDFPGLDSVHTEVRRSDAQPGQAGGQVVTKLDWQKDRAEIDVFPGVYDLVIRRGPAAYIVDDVDCRSGDCRVAAGSSLTVAFPGLSAVDVDVSLPDGKGGAAGGALAAQKTWQNNRAQIAVLRGSYDLTVRRGPVSYVVDGFDCRAATCQTTVASVTLSVDFRGLNWVSTEVRAADGRTGDAGGAYVTKSNNQADDAELVVLPGRYDVVVRRGAATYVVDDVDCRPGGCQVAASSRLTVAFPTLTSVHTDVRLPDGQSNLADGELVTQKKWQNDQAEIVVLRGVYDLSVEDGPTSFVIDGVDCRTANCQAAVERVNLRVDFPGLNWVTTEVRHADGRIGVAGGEYVTKLAGQKDRAELSVLPGRYDLLIRRGAASYVIDDVDCRADACQVAASSTMTVVFSGISTVHTEVRLPDGQHGVADGDLAAEKKWQNGQAEITVLRGVYDLNVQEGPVSVVIDDVDCRGVSCEAAVQPVRLSVDFPGLSSVHTEVRQADGRVEQAGGGYVAGLKWQKDRTEFALLPGIYDLVVRKGPATYIVDDVDCRSSSCRVAASSALTVAFPKLSTVHTEVRLSDGQSKAAGGELAAEKKWQNDRAEITVLRGVYDLSVQDGPVSFVIDDVDCRGASCQAAVERVSLRVDFPGLAWVSTEVRQADGRAGEAGGEYLTKLYNQVDQAALSVLPGRYDLIVRRGAATYVIDDLDCRSVSCQAAASAELTVEFPELKAVHTQVLLPDGQIGVAAGEQAAEKKWQDERAEITVLRGTYDLIVRDGPVDFVADDVDCRGATCLVDGTTAELVVEFPGLINVHTAAFVPDGIADRVEGDLTKQASYESNQSQLTVLRHVYDVRVEHAETQIFDDVDCRGGSCRLSVQGNLQATLIDADAGSPLSAVSLWAYEVHPDGTLTKQQRGVTDSVGRVHFTLPSLNSGSTYVLDAESPFGNGRRYYSPLIRRTGPFEFRITRDGAYPLDIEQPELAFSKPIDGARVSVNGFDVAGWARDNTAVGSVRLTVVDAVKGRTEMAADYSENDDTWSARVTGDMVSRDRQVALIATVTDRSNNAKTSLLTLRVIEDTTGPDIRIISHAPDDLVSASGFLLSGTVTDELEVAELQATVHDGVSSAPSVVDRALGVDNGAWTLVVDRGAIVAGHATTIVLVAADSDGNRSEKTIRLQVGAETDSVRHMIDRITFGATPDLIDEVSAVGPVVFLERQLDPLALDDSELETRLPFSAPATKEELQARVLLRMTYTRRQLLEVMTWFWDNHFNTNIDTQRRDAHGNELSVTVADEWRENQLFRQHALGNFRDLLEASATSPAMLIYLDSVNNVYTDSNENYARELLELHTVGVDAGYTDDDVAAAAEILTGWTAFGDAFYFDVGRHNYEAQTVMGETFPAGGVSQGDMLLDFLAAHPSTARFICAKLTTLLVSDSPPETLIVRCADTFVENVEQPDQIARVLRAILTSPEFAGEHHSKIKSPLEFVVGTLRALEVETDATELADAMGAMGLRLFENPVPTGYAEEGEAWINSHLLLERIKWVNALVRHAYDGSVAMDPVGLFAARGYVTTEGIVGYLLRLALDDDFGDFEVGQATEVLNQPTPFDPTAADAEERLRRLEGVVLSLPQYQYQ